MAISSSQRTEIDISDLLIDVPNPDAAAESAALFAIDKIKEYMLDGNSPVKGEGKFPKLSQEYAEKMKGGDTLANLYLEGDLQNSIDWEFDGTNLIIGVESSQEGKADGHNNFSGDSKLPTRRFLADNGQVFKFQNEMENIVSLFKQPIEDVISEMVREKEFSALPSELTFKQKIVPRSDISIDFYGIGLEDLKGLF